MLEDRLNGLALMHIHKEIEPDVDDIMFRTFVVLTHQHRCCYLNILAITPF